MRLRRLVAGTIAAVVLLAGAMTISGTAAAKPDQPVFWVDLMGTATPHPHRVFFTADAGGHVLKIKWRNWGRRKAVGRGTFGSSAPPPPGESSPTGPARLIAWKPIRCVPAFGSKKGREILVYRHVKLRYPDGKGRVRWADVSQTAGYLSCR